MIISEGRRLSYYQARADSKFWDGHWSKLAKKAEWEKVEQGFLGWFESPFTKYLPKTGKIIEAGCGLGYYVLAPGRRGYDIEGVEWSRKAVDLIKGRYPKLKVRTGDVRKLAVKDGYYSVYISLGVVEHCKSGPEDYLREAYRVLKLGGVAFVSVPHFNLLRRIKKILGFYRGNPSGLDFYQYAFTETEIDDLIEKAGFRVIDHFRYDAYKGLREEIPVLKNIIFKKPAVSETMIGKVNRKEFERKSKNRVLVNRPLYLRTLDYLFGHMTMAICIKR